VTSSHVKNLTVQTWWLTMTASHSSFIEVPSTDLQVCVCVCACVRVRVRPCANSQTGCQLYCTVNVSALIIPQCLYWMVFLPELPKIILAWNMHQVCVSLDCIPSGLVNNSIRFLKYLILCVCTLINISVTTSPVSVRMLMLT